MSSASDVIDGRGLIFTETEKAEFKTYIDKQDFVQKTPWWIISIVFHAAFLMMAAMIIVSESLPEEEFAIFEMDVKKFKKPEYDETLKRDIVKSTKNIEDEIMVENPVITKEDLPIDEIETPDEVEREHKAKGRQEAISTIELGGEGWVGVFGVGGGGSGAYGWRDGGGKRRAVGKGGGSPATESAVDAALRWFKRHQAADGSWSFENYKKECKDAPPCSTIDAFAKHGGLDDKSMNNAATGFGLLCYLGAGHTSKAGKYRTQVVNGLAYLTDNQDESGSFASNNYCHAIASMALAEAFGMTRDESLKTMAQKAADQICARQNAGGYLGWDYQKPSKRSDTSVTGWQVMALKSAKASGLEIGNAFEGASAFIKKVTPEVTGDEYDPKMEDVGYTYTEGDKGNGHSNTRLTAIGLLVRVFLGQDTSSKVMRAHGNRLLGDLPQMQKTDYYQTYYATLAMFQMGGEYWKKYNEAMKKVLLDKQCMGGCADGSWDPHSANKYGSERAGRLFVTAVGCLSLEVYYRYLPVSMLK